jgi:hypothetical protein
VDRTKWDQQQRIEAGVQIQEQLNQNQTQRAAENQPTTYTGYGSDSAFANSPSTDADKGTLTKFGQDKGDPPMMTVGEPIKTESLL